MTENTIKEIISSIEDKCPTEDILMVSSNDKGEIGVCIRGNCMNITQAIFGTMHDPNNQDVAKQLTVMLKSLVFNILNNPSPLADELLSLMVQLSSDDVNAPQKTETDKTVNVSFGKDGGE